MASSQTRNSALQEVAWMVYANGVKFMIGRKNLTTNGLVAQLLLGKFEIPKERQEAVWSEYSPKLKKALNSIRNNNSGGCKKVMKSKYKVV